VLKKKLKRKIVQSKRKFWKDYFQIKDKGYFKVAFIFKSIA